MRFTLPERVDTAQLVREINEATGLGLSMEEVGNQDAWHHTETGLTLELDVPEHMAEEVQRVISQHVPAHWSHLDPETGTWYTLHEGVMYETTIDGKLRRTPINVEESEEDQG